MLHAMNLEESLKVFYVWWDKCIGGQNFLYLRNKKQQQAYQLRWVWTIKKLGLNNSVFSFKIALRRGKEREIGIY